MKKNKLFTPLLLLCLTVCISIGFTACSDSTSNNTNSKTVKANGDAAKKETTGPNLDKLPKKPGMHVLQFKSKDGLPITADHYHIRPELPVMVLCHQARSNKYEYDFSARMLNNEGFNCIAIDQRSGGDIFGGNNATYQMAKAKEKSTEFLDAEQDIITAINYAADLYGQPVVLVGSSYSASLALKIAAENDKVKAVMSFSPGEYFGEAKSETYIQEAVKNLNKPVFITSSKAEAPKAKVIFDAIAAKDKVQFIPKAKGVHGASALMDKPENDEYWAATRAFVKGIK